jgi:hypothetical protein
LSSSSSITKPLPVALPNVCDSRKPAADKLDRAVLAVDALESERECTGSTGRVYLSSSALPPIAVKRLCRRVLAQLAEGGGPSATVLTREEHWDAERGHSSSPAAETALALNGEGRDESEASESERTDEALGQLAMFAKAPAC